GGAVVFQQGAFGQLHVQVRWLQPVAFQYLLHEGRQLQVVEVGGREIDRHRRHSQPLPPPLRQLPTGLLQHPATQGSDQTALLGQGYEAVRWNGPQGRMLPARQGFKPVQTPHRQFDLWLVIQLQTTSLQRLPQRYLQGKTLLGGAAQRQAEEAD